MNKKAANLFKKSIFYYVRTEVLYVCYILFDMIYNLYLRSKTDTKEERYYLYILVEMDAIIYKRFKISYIKIYTGY